MATRSVVVCEDCNVVEVLPTEPEALAQSMAVFVDAHNRLQHYHIELQLRASNEQLA